MGILRAPKRTSKMSISIDGLAIAFMLITVVVVVAILFVARGLSHGDDSSKGS